MLSDIILLLGITGVFVLLICGFKLLFDLAYKHIPRFRAEIDWLTAASADWEEEGF